MSISSSALVKLVVDLLEVVTSRDFKYLMVSVIGYEFENEVRR